MDATSAIRDRGWWPRACMCHAGLNLVQRLMVHQHLDRLDSISATPDPMVASSFRIPACWRCHRKPCADRASTQG